MLCILSIVRMYELLIQLQPISLFECHLLLRAPRRLRNALSSNAGATSTRAMQLQVWNLNEIEIAIVYVWTRTED